MSVINLQTKNFRNLTNTDIVFHQDQNFIIGENGSGKSSILEAIFFLAHGKSFRTTKIDNIALFGCNDVVVSVKNNDDKRLGLFKDFSSAKTTIRIDGESHSRLSELAKNVAVQIITPESFKLFFGGPKERRRFVDLGMFHVKHLFSSQWSEFNKVLKHRNACLRNKADKATLSYWTQLFCQHSNDIAAQRSGYIESLIAEVKIWVNVLLPSVESDIDVQYLRGWNQQYELEDVLKKNELKEVQNGYSMYGAHKFDVRFLLNKNPIENMLSRGQQKLFLLALTFAQAKLIEKVNRVKPILLIDDVGAELDESSRLRLKSAIGRLDCQVIITAIDSVAIEPLVPSDNKYKMFHVKHGEVSEINE